MTHSKQSAKRVVQNEKRRDRNRAVRSAVKTAIKKVGAAPDRAQASAAYSAATKQIDKAAKVGSIHRNAAARLKSRMSKAAAAKA